jgi:hypothetical protein
METKRHPVNLKQYRKVNGKWQFVPVARDAEGVPVPRLVVIDGEPTASSTTVLQTFKFCRVSTLRRIRRVNRDGEMERHMLQTAKTLAEIIMFRSDLGFVTL